jgi:ABC-type nitrate/sulfonate/bicarbonate transport system permease component
MAAVLPLPAQRPAAPAPATPWQRAWRRLKRRHAALLGLVVVLLFIALAVFAPWVSPQDPIATSWSAIRQAPSAQHWFGTDDIGRDVLSRVIWGTRASLLAGVVSVSIALLIGVPLGLLAGFVGGWIDGVISRVTDAFLACPFLILAIALAAFLGPSLTNAMVAIGISAAPIFVRLTRGQVLGVKVEDYVEAARAVGIPPLDQLEQTPMDLMDVPCDLRRERAVLLRPGPVLKGDELHDEHAVVRALGDGEMEIAAGARVRWRIVDAALRLGEPPRETAAFQRRGALGRELRGQAFDRALRIDDLLCRDAGQLELHGESLGEEGGIALRDAGAASLAHADVDDA